MQPVIEGLMEFQWNMFTDEMKRVYDNYGIAQMYCIHILATQGHYMEQCSCI